MNKIYKVIWNRVKNCYVVVSEIAKREGKSGAVQGGTFLRAMIISSLCMGAAFLLPTMPVRADSIGTYHAGDLKWDKDKHNKAEWDPNHPVTDEDYGSIGVRSGKARLSFLMGLISGETVAGKEDGLAEELKHRTAIGNRFRVFGFGATAYGYGTNAEGEGSLAVGHAATTNGNEGTAIGYYAKVLKGQGTVVGSHSWANDQAVALGADVRAQGYASISIGSDDADPKAFTGSKFSDKLPEETINKIYKDMINDNPTWFKNKYMIDDAGNDRRVWSPNYAAGEASIAIGSRTVALGDASTSIGVLAMALADRSTAVGVRSLVSSGAKGGMALGEESRVMSKDGLAVGNKTYSSGDGSLAYGYDAKALGANSIAIGHNVGANAMLNHEAQVTMANVLLYNGEGKIKPTGTSFDTTQDRINYLERIMGDYDKKNKQWVDDEGSVLRQWKDGNNGPVRTEYRKKQAQVGPKRWSDNAIAIGRRTYAIGDNSLVLGSLSLGAGNNSLNVGHFTYTKGENSAAIGMEAAAIADNSMAIGVRSFANLTNSVAIGVGSKTDYTKDDLEQDGWAPRNAITFPSSTQVGVVSVGKIGSERRISNVASGYRDTDAVNVSQLRALEERFSSNLPEDSDLNPFSYLAVDKMSGDVTKVIPLQKKEMNYRKYVNYRIKQIELQVREKHKEKVDETFKNRIQTVITNLEKGDNKTGIDASGLKGKNVDTILNELKAKYPGLDTSDTNEVINKLNEWKKEKLKDSLKKALTNDEQDFLKGTNYLNDGAKGKDAIAVGYKAQSLADNSIAIGKDSHVDKGAQGGIALGASSSATRAGGQRAYDFDNDRVFADDNAAGRGQGGIHANKSDTGALSIGRADYTRQITNVAGGSEDTDAVNVAQLKRVNTKVNNVNTKVEGNIGFNIEGNSGGQPWVAAGTKDSQKGKISLKIRGGDNDSNINVDLGRSTKDGFDTIEAKINLNHNLGNLESATFTKTEKGVTTTSVINDKGLTIGSGNSAVTLTKDGLNMGNHQIHGVAEGKADTDAVNVAQVNKAIQAKADELKKKEIKAAQDTANTANSNATEAKTTANEAKTTAEQAKTTADTVNKDLASYKTEVTGKLNNKANTGLDNLTQSGKTVVKNLAKEQIDTTVTETFVTGKVKKGSVKSTTLTVTGDGKVVSADLTLEIKDKAISKGKLGDELVTEIEGKATKDEVANKAEKTYVDNQLNTKVNISDFDTYKGQVTTDLAGKADVDGGNITAPGQWAGKLGTGTVAENDANLVTGGKVFAAIKDKADKSELTNKADTSLNNITGAGNTVIKNLAKDAVKVAAGTNTTVTTEDGKDGSKTYKVNVSDEDIKKAVESDLNNKADKSTVTADLANKADKDASNVTNVTAWAGKLGTGTVAENDANLVTGGKVYAAIKDKANTSLDNLAPSGKTVVKNLAKEQIDTTVTETFVTDKVKKGSVTSTTLTVTGDGKVVSADLTLEIKDKAISKGKLSDELVKEIEGKATKDEVANKAEKTYVDNQLNTKVNTSDFDTYKGKVTTDLAKKADVTGGNITAPGKWAEKLGTGTVAENDTNLVTGGTVQAALKPVSDKADKNETNITTLQKGFTLQDVNKTVGQQTVKAGSTVKVTGDKYVTATVNANGLTLGLNEATLNTQINDQITNNTTVKGKMDSWKLKATGDTEEQEIKDGNTVTFAVAEAGKGLTVSRDGNTIKYGIDGSKIDLTSNTSITNINNTLKADKATVAAGDYVTVKTTTDAETGNTFTVNGPKITGEGSVSVSDIEEGGKKVGYKITGKNTTLAAGTSGLSVNGGKLKLNVADTDGNAVTGEVDLNGIDFSNNKTVKTINENITNLQSGFTIQDEATPTAGKKVIKAKDTITFKGDSNITAAVGTDGSVTYSLNKTGITNTLNDTFAKVDASNVGDAERTAWAGKLGTGTVAANDGNLVTGGTVQAALKPVSEKADKNVKDIAGLTTRVGKNESDIQTLQGGFTLQDANKTVGKQTVTAGSTVKVTGDKYVTATVNDNGLTLGLNEATLNNQINTQITSNSTVTGKMSAWKLKATGDTAEQEIKDGNTVTFAVAEAGKGLTVSRDGNTIKYGIDGSKIDLTSNTSITNINTTLKSNKATVAAGDYVTVKTTTDAETGNTFTVNGPKITGEGSVSVSDIEEGGKKVGYKITGKNTTLAAGTTGLSVDAGKLKLNVADTDNNTVTGEVDLKTLDLSGNTTVNNLDTKIENITKTGGLLDKKADKDAGNIGNAERTAWAGKLGTGKVEANNANLVTGKTVYDFVNPVKIQAETNATNITGLTTRVGTNESDIKTLQGGFTLQDANTPVGKQTVKAGSKVTVTGDDYIKTKVDTNGLKLSMDETKLNSQINTLITSNSTVTGKMSAWKLKATGVDGEGTVNNTDNTVTFDAETAKGLTVSRDGNTIKYGINIDSLASNITNNVVNNINAGNTVITNISTGFTVSAGNNTPLAMDMTKDKKPNLQFVSKDGNTEVTAEKTATGTKVTIGLSAAAQQGLANQDLNFAGTSGTGKVNLKTQKLSITGDSDGIISTTAKEQGLSMTVDKEKLASAVNSSTTKITNVDLSNNSIVKGKMDSWQLAAKSTDDGAKIDNTNNKVVFDVAVAGKGLTVSREGNTIKYGIEGSKIDLTNNTAITNINNTLKEDKATVVAGDYVTVTTTADTEKGNTFTVKGPEITGEGSVSVSDIVKGSKKVGYKITGKNTTLKAGATGLSVADGTLKLNVADTDNNTVTGEVDLKTLDLSGNTTINNLDTKIENITKTDGLLDKKANKDASNIGETERTAWATKLGTGKVEANDANLVTGGTVQAALKPVSDKADQNATNIATLQKGFTLKDGNTPTAGSKTVTAESVVTVTGDDYIKTKVDTNGLTLSMDETKLNSQINTQITSNSTVTGKMSAWKLKATGVDGEGTVNNTDNTVTFDVVKAGKGLTVSRDGNTIKYGIDGSKIDFSNNDMVKTINGNITNLQEGFTIQDEATPMPGKKVIKAKDTITFKSGANLTSKVGDDGSVTYGLNSALTNMNSITFAALTPAPGATSKALTIDGTAGTITGLTNTTWNANAITSGRAATEDQLKALSDTVSGNASDSTDFRLVKAGTTTTTDGNGVYTPGTNGNIELLVQDKNHKGNIETITISDVAKQTELVKLQKKLEEGFTVGEAGQPGKDGKDGTISVNGKDGSAVVINGKDGSIGMKGKDGANGKLFLQKVPGLDGADGETRMVYEADGKENVVATKDDGFFVEGDMGDKSIKQKLNTLLRVRGGNKDEKELTENNIGVVGSTDRGLDIKLAKNLKDLSSATFTKTVQNGDKEETTSTVINDLGTTVTDKDGNTNQTTAGGTVIQNKDGTEKVEIKKDGITITDAGDNTPANPGKTISLTKDGFDNGGNKITNIAKGMSDNDAATVGQVNAAKKAAMETLTAGFDVKAGNVTGTVSLKANEKPTVEFLSSGSGLTVDLMTDAKTHTQKITYRLSDTPVFGEKAVPGEAGNPGKPGKDGKDGKVEVIGKDGSSVVINGKDGSIGLNGKDGKDGIGINGKDGGSITIHGTNGADGQDGENGLTIRGVDGKNGEKGEKGVDGTTDINRVVTVDPNGTRHQLATLDDGLKFAGNVGNFYSKLNETVEIVGGVTVGEHEKAEDKLTNENIGVVANKEAGKNGKLDIKLAKNLKDLSSATFTKTVQNGDKEETTSTVINDLGTTVTDKDGNTNQTTAGGTVIQNKAGTEKVEIKKDGITITDAGDNTPANPKKKISLTKDGLNMGGQEITNVKESTTATSAATVGQVNAAKKAAMDTLAAGFDVKAGTVTGTVSLKANEKPTVEFLSAGNGLSVDLTTDAKTHTQKITYRLSDTPVFGEKTVSGEGGKPGKDGKVEVIGKDGSAVVINGKDGSIGLNGKDGKDGIGINGKDGGSITIHGTNGADGQDGENGLTIRGVDGKNGEKGEKGVDGTTDINRVVTVDPNGTKHQLATLDDGLKFAGDSGDAIAKKLNETVTISGGVTDETKLTDNNIGVVAKDGKLNVKLAKNLTGLESATFTKTVQNGDKEETTSTVINDLGTTVTDKDGNTNQTTAGGTVIQNKDGTEKVEIKKDGITITDAGDGTLANPGKTISLTKDGFDNGGNKITNIANGIADNDAATVGQVNEVKNTIGKDISKLKAGFNIKGNTGESTVALGGDTAPAIEFAGDGNLTSKVEQGKITYSLNNKITIGDKKVTVDGTTGTITGLMNIKWDKDNVAKGRAATEGQLNDVQASVQKEIKEIKELSDKTVTYKDKEKNEIALAGKAGTKITNLKDGDISKDSKDAVNGGQLFATKNDLRLKEGTVSYDKKTGNGVMTLTQGDGETANKVEVKGLQNTYTESGAYDEKAKALVFTRNDNEHSQYKVDLSRFVRGIDFSLNKLDRKINGVGAGAAALAALQPLDFDPDAKWDFSAGYGQYKGAIAAAVGAYYRPNEDTLFSMGGTFGAGENMFNAGVSVKLGQGNHVTTSRVAMAKDMLAMQQRMAQMEEQMAKMQELITALTGGTPQAHDMFPDVPKNHWAYEYIRSLAKRGILEGYENGKFDGDRTMSRYEFAAMLYRAMKKGVDLDKRAVAEFAPELDRVRVDVITRHKNGDPDIERVRVNK